METSLAFTSATEIRRLFLNKELSPVELTRLFLDRIDAIDGQLNSYLTISAEEALDLAREAEKAMMNGIDKGPLHGVPVSIKDLEMTKGTRTTGGSLIYRDRIPTSDSTVVERVRAAGAIILGKTNTPEFGLLGHTQNLLGDHCRNPWNTELTTGGSSGGAGSSLAAGLCSLATGSDGGGSIRIPASFCGIYGIKPTQGRVPLYPGISGPVTVNHFSQSGPMSRTVEDSALLLQVMAGHDLRDVNTLRDKPGHYLAAMKRSVEGLKIAWSPDFGYAAVDQEVARICKESALLFEEMGCVVEEVSLNLDESIFDAFWTLFTAVMSARYSPLVADKMDLLTEYGRECLDFGANVSGAEFAKALGARAELTMKFGEIFDRYDVILSPTLATPAFPVGVPPDNIDGQSVHSFWGFLPFTFPINIIGNPSASIPCGFTEQELPIGLQIVGRWGDEETVISVSAAFEKTQPWLAKRPIIS